MTIKAVLGLGLGVDSTAILLRWRYEPWTMPCKPEELLVITAMTGDEWEETGRLVREHIIPLLREWGVRFVQVARSRATLTEARRAHAEGLIPRGDNVTVLDDSTAVTELFIEGDYKLSQEMNGNGTVPQVGGIRKCSIHAKGEIIDRFLVTDLAGAPFLHVIGFEANELGRAVRDKKYDTGEDAPAGRPASRTGMYPLIEWGWDRAACEEYITRMTGAAWVKSACVFCPFALANKEGIARVKPMYSAQVSGALAALVMEYRSVALNPAQGLVKSGTLLEMLLATRQHGPVLRAFAEHLGRMEWRVYEVRRVAMPTSDPAKGDWNRSVRSIAAGSRPEMLAELEALAADEGTTVEKDHLAISRAYMARRGDSFPAYERMYVVAPAGVADKEPVRFTNAMARYQAISEAA